MTPEPAWRTPLDLRLQTESTWITLAPLSFDSVALPGLLTVPAEFITDLGSVPRLPFAYLISGGRAPGPAVLHDYLYQHPLWTDRALADAIFYEAMGVVDAELGHRKESAIQRYLMWLAVRVAGWHAFRDHRARARDLNPIWASTGWPTSGGETQGLGEKPKDQSL